MIVTSSVDSEIFLTSLVADSESYSTPEHHLRAFHKVIHTVLQCWHKCFLINHIEVDHLIRNDLDSNVASDKVDLTSHFINFVVLGPLVCLGVYFEEQKRV